MYARNYFHQTSVVASRIIILFASRLIQQIKFKSDGYGQEIKKNYLLEITNVMPCKFFLLKTDRNRKDKKYMACLCTLKLKFHSCSNFHQFHKMQFLRHHQREIHHGCTQNGRLFRWLEVICMGKGELNQTLEP